MLLVPDPWWAMFPSILQPSFSVRWELARTPFTLSGKAPPNISAYTPFLLLFWCVLYFFSPIFINNTLEVTT